MTRMLDELFARLMSSATDLLDAESPLDLETAVSDLCGMWWGQELIDADPEEIFGVGLVHYALRRPSAQARLLLAGLAAVGSPAIRKAARRGLPRLAGQPAPGWIGRLGTAQVGRAWLGSDRYGDQDVIVLECSYDGDWPHVINTLVDHNVFGIATDTFVGSPEIVAVWQDEDPTMFGFGPAPVEKGVGRMLGAFRRTDRVLDPPVSEDFASGRGVALARAATVARPDAPPEPEAVAPAARAELVDQFLASCTLRRSITATRQHRARRISWTTAATTTTASRCA